jgi:ketosteroid isomerase-like protein
MNPAQVPDRNPQIEDLVEAGILGHLQRSDAPTAAMESSCVVIMPAAFVWEVRDGKVVRGQEYMDTWALTNAFQTDDS